MPQVVLILMKPISSSISLIKHRLRIAVSEFEISLYPTKYWYYPQSCLALSFTFWQNHFAIELATKEIYTAWDQISFVKTIFGKKNVSQTFFPYFQILFICTNRLDLICLILHHWQLVFEILCHQKKIQ